MRLKLKGKGEGYATKKQFETNKKNKDKDSCFFVADDVSSYISVLGSESLASM